jgi:hypothetical protein
MRAIVASHLLLPFPTSRVPSCYSLLYNASLIHSLPLVYFLSLGLYSDWIGCSCITTIRLSIIQQTTEIIKQRATHGLGVKYKV